MLHSEPFQRFRAEVLQELLPRVLLGEHPVVELEYGQLVAEILLEVLAPCLVVEHLLWREVANELLHVVVSALSGEELSGGNVEEADAACRLAEVHCREKVVLLVVEHVVAHGYARRDEFRNAALHHLVHFREPLLALYHGPFLLRVFQLVAYRHALSRPDKLGQVSVECVVRESRHLRSRRRAVVAFGQRQAKYLRRFHGILAVGLIEVAAAEKQQRVRVLRLHGEELPHHWRERFI